MRLAAGDLASSVAVPESISLNRVQHCDGIQLPLRSVSWAMSKHTACTGDSAHVLLLAMPRYDPLPGKMFLCVLEWTVLHVPMENSSFSH